jgi:YbgC/YbaW family acyl-CoA thioester hydrolase
LTRAFHYHRLVQFAETDLAGIVHFSWMFRYMEEAEHALWRAAGLSIHQREDDMGWPRVAASFEFRNPLRFEEEFDVLVRLQDGARRSLRYDHTIVRGDTVIGTGTMTAVCVSKSPDGSMRAIEIPSEIVRRLRAALA